MLESLIGQGHKILCIGSASKDVFLPTAEGKIVKTPRDLTAKTKICFEMGAKFHVENRFEALGGCATNVASGLAKLGEKPLSYSVIGDDELGRWILQNLKKSGIGHQFLEIKTATSSDLSTAIIDLKSGERIIFSNQTANRKLLVRKNKLRGFEWVFVGDLNGDWHRNLATILEAGRQYKCRLVYNPRQKNIHEDPVFVQLAIAGSEIVFMNKDEALEIAAVNSRFAETKLDDEIVLLKYFRKLGPRIVVITDGLRGAWACDRKGAYFAKALKQNAVDTTGAGDAFAAGFLGAIVKGLTIEEALAWGMVNGSSSVCYYGGSAGQLDSHLIESWSKRVKILKLN